MGVLFIVENRIQVCENFRMKMMFRKLLNKYISPEKLRAFKALESQMFIFLYFYRAPKTLEISNSDEF